MKIFVLIPNYLDIFCHSASELCFFLNCRLIEFRFYYLFLITGTLFYFVCIIYFYLLFFVGTTWTCWPCWKGWFIWFARTHWSSWTSWSRWRNWPSCGYFWKFLKYFFFKTRLEWTLVGVWPTKRKMSGTLINVTVQHKNKYIICWY